MFIVISSVFFLFITSSNLIFYLVHLHATKCLIKCHSELHDEKPGFMLQNFMNIKLNCHK
ncbi:hypothetical protein HanRHA438_Chr00c12g0849071 [Helianthus annuus]|nr:hypothetical protein HanRHA438_Chr00c12g0849071 [Helianthus annuus]